MRLRELLKQEYKPVAQSHASTLLVGFVGGMLICLLTGPNVFPSLDNFMTEVFAPVPQGQHSSAPLLVAKDDMTNKQVLLKPASTQPRRIAMLSWLESVFSRERVNQLVR